MLIISMNNFTDVYFEHPTFNRRQNLFSFQQNLLTENNFKHIAFFIKKKNPFTLSGHNAVSEKAITKLLVKRATVLYNCFTVRNRQNL